jgi:hypothetical protein
LRLNVLAVVDEGSGISSVSIKFLRPCDKEKRQLRTGSWKQRMRSDWGSELSFPSIKSLRSQFDFAILMSESSFVMV